MNKEIIIEHYLSKLERELQALPTGDRAEILTEIRSHIFEASEKHPEREIARILDDMGTPEAVAARYLAQKGVPYKATTSAPRRWLRILAAGMAGVFVVCVASVLFAIWYFSPLLKVDEAAGRVTLLGGLIDVNEPAGEVKIGSMHVKADMSDDHDSEFSDDISLNLGGATKVSGGEDLQVRKVKTLSIPFNNAKLEVSPSKNSRFEWDCKNLTAGAPPVSVNAGVMTLDLEKVSVAKCSLRIPDGIKTEVRGVNGKIELNKPRSDFDVKVTNGKVDIDPDPSRVYDFEVKVANGVHDHFARSEAKDALKVKVDVINGVVKKE